jgi:hypothetical protein
VRQACAESYDVDAGHLRSWAVDGVVEISIRIDRLTDVVDARPAVDRRQEEAFANCLSLQVPERTTFGPTSGDEWELDGRATGGGAQEFVAITMSGLEAKDCDLATAVGWMAVEGHVISASITTCAGAGQPDQRTVYDQLDRVAQRITG